MAQHIEEGEGGSSSPSNLTSTIAKGSVAPPLLTLNIHIEIRQMQLQNGLKYQDFQRYWMYCTKRLHKLRDVLHFKNGRKQYHQKPLPEEISDKRYLKLLLVLSERSWSHGNLLKYEYSNASIAKPRKRFHSIRRFAKAEKHSSLLETLCSKFADRKTFLEAQAYHGILKSLLLLERKQWLEASENLLVSHNVLTQLKRFAMGNAGEEQTFKAKIEELDPMFRLCEYRLGDEFKKLKMQLRSIRQIDDAAIEEVSPSDGKMIDTFIVRGRPVKVLSDSINMEILQCIQQFDKLSVPSELLAKDGWLFLDNLDSSDIIEKYGILADLFSELNQSIKAEMLALADVADSSWITVQGYAMDVRYLLDIERNVLLLLLYLQKLQHYTGVASTKMNYEEGLRYSELIIQDLEGILSRNEESSEEDVYTHLLQQSLIIVTRCRIFCLSFLLYSFEKYDDALVLINFVIKQSRPITFEATADGITRYFIRVVQLFSKLQILLHSLFEPLLFRCLSLHSKNYHSLQDPPSLDASHLQGLEVLEGIHFPPVPQIIACKPLLFDLAFTAYSAPDISHRCKSEEPTGLIGRLRSLWK